MKITVVSESVRSIELDSIEVRNAVNFWLWLELGWRFGSDWKYEVPEMDGLTATAVAGGVSPKRRGDSERQKKDFKIGDMDDRGWICDMVTKDGFYGHFSPPQLDPLPLRNEKTT